MRTSFVLGIVLLWNGFSCLGSDAPKAAEEAREALRKQGFKTDLSDFNFFTDQETAVRAAALTNIARARPALLLQPVGTDAAIVAWKQTGFQEEEGYQLLRAIEELMATNQATLDGARAAALSGPIHFPLIAKHGSYMLLVHLAPLQNLSQALAARMIVELREKQYGEAWTNLLALTRLATAWEPEAAEVSHIIRFKLTRTAWKAAWQAMQTHLWTEAQLMALEHEWETPDFFKGLPDTLAFQRASLVDTCIQQRQAPPAPTTPLKDILQNSLRSPSSAMAEAKYRLDRAEYRATGTYEDEHDLLLFFRDREIEWRKAITASTWLQMRDLPGVTNAAPFRSKYYSSMQAMLNSRQMSIGYQLEGKALLGFAAESEARRRLIIAAIALERYRLAHGSYPNNLASLAPEGLKTVPADFMDGKPLRYRLREPSTFVLYSAGLDCLDDGGKFGMTSGAQLYYNSDPSNGPDLVWPRAASDAETQGFYLEKAKAKEELIKKSEREAEEREREDEEQRQKLLKELGFIYTNGGPLRVTDPKTGGGPLKQVLRNKALGGPPPRLDEMLTLHQVTTGEEPDIATFEMPISYDALKNVGTLRLLCDADPSEKFFSGRAEMQQCVRATNGNCRLVWNTMYDPPGKHFLQTELLIDNRVGSSRRRNRDSEELILKGPLFAFVSTNALQYFPMGDVYTQKGAFFRVKLAHPVGSYILKISSPSGEHLHTITGSTSNGIVDVEWDLIDDDGKRYTNETLSSTWTITFPDAADPRNTSKP